MLLSIIIPVYNVENYIRQCLDSVLTNKFADMEIILVDDGSTDTSGSICDEYAKRDERIYVIHKANGGVSSARNAGLKKANGKYIMWVDPDDYLSAGWLKALLPLLDKGYDVVFFDHFRQYRNNAEEISYGGASRELDKNNYIAELCRDKKIKSYVWDKIIKSSLYDSIRFPEDISLMEDYHVLYKVIFNAHSIYYLAKFLYHYRIHEASICHQASLPVRYQAVGIAQKRYQWFRLQGVKVSKNSYLNHAFWFCSYCCRCELTEAQQYYEKVKEGILEDLDFQSIIDSSFSVKVKLLLLKVDLFRQSIMVNDFIKNKLKEIRNIYGGVTASDLNNTYAARIGIEMRVCVC